MQPDSSSSNDLHCCNHCKTLCTLLNIKQVVSLIENIFENGSIQLCFVCALVLYIQCTYILVYTIEEGLN